MASRRTFLLALGAAGTALGAGAAGAAFSAGRLLGSSKDREPALNATRTRTDELTSDGVRVLRNGEHFPNGFTVPEGETWSFDPDAEATVTTGGNVIVHGTLRMGHCHCTHVLRFVDVEESRFIGGHVEVPPASDVGLWVMGDGVLDVRGSDRTPWTRAARTLTSGATTVELATAPQGWAVGDEVVITPTESFTDNGEAYAAYDTARVAAIDGRSLSLDRPLTHPHPVAVLPRGLAFGAEVLNLTRSVVIEGTPEGRAHIAFLHTHVPQMVANVRIRHMGPRKRQGGQYKGEAVATPVVGRYGLHVHMAGEGARGSLLENVVVTDTVTHAFVVHSSHGVTLTGCISHDTVGAGYWWDPGTEALDVNYRQCVASKVGRMRLDPRHTEFNGYRLSGFWLGAGNRIGISECVAVGVNGSRQAAGLLWPEGDQGVWTFERNVSHNNAEHGIFVWHNSTEPHVVDRAVCYHNGDAEILNGAYVNTYSWVDCVVVHDGDDPSRPESWGEAVPFEAHAVNRGHEGQPVLTLDRCWFENRSGADAYLSPKHNITIDALPIRVRHCVFDGQFRRKPDLRERIRFEQCLWLRPETLRFGGASSEPSWWEIEDTRHGAIRLTDPGAGAPGSTYHAEFDADVLPIPSFSQLQPIATLPDLSWPPLPGEAA